MAKDKRRLYVALNSRRRDDGTMFVTSPNAAFFSAITTSLDEAVELLREYIERNFGPVDTIAVADDVAQVAGDEFADTPPAHVIAELTHGVGVDRTG